MGDRLEDVRSQLEEARHKLCVLQVGLVAEQPKATASNAQVSWSTHPH